ncbi:MAG: hypothetical protein P8Y10_08575 [Gemmatimonadales bacterium]
MRHLARRFKALSEESRLDILLLLFRYGELCGCEVERFENGELFIVAAFEHGQLSGIAPFEHAQAGDGAAEKAAAEVVR